MTRLFFAIPLVFACAKPAPKFAEICAIDLMARQPLLDKVCGTPEVQLAYDAALAAAREICASPTLPPEAEPVCSAL